MRKINKICEFSTAYKKQEEEWEALTPIRHNKKTGYNSSNNKYYHCVKMELLRCQGGLCAYSEKFLCGSEHYSSDKWQDGVYNSEEGKKIKVNLDHFDSLLKEDRGWLWDNFFATHPDVNNAKLEKNIDPRLKPTDKNFDPLTLFDYNLEEHIFVANPKLQAVDNAFYDAVNAGIENLGINLTGFKDERKAFIEREARYDEAEDVYQFPTAWEFWQRKQGHHKTDTHPTANEYE
jgi:hypothetical protein